MCPRTLFSSPRSSWLGSPQPREMAQLSLFQPPEVHKGPRLSPNHQSHLCCHLDNTSPRLAFTSTSTVASGCSIPRLEELVPVSPCSCPSRGLQLFHSQVNFTSKIMLAKCASDVHSLVNFTSKIVLANSLLTFTPKSPQVSDLLCKCTSDFHSQVASPLKTCLLIHHWLSLTSLHECAIQVHTQERAIQVHG